MNRSECLKLIADVNRGHEFLNRYQDVEVIINDHLMYTDLERMNKEYANLIPSLDQYSREEQFVSITIVSRVIESNGYPKLRAYLKKENNEILRILVSE